MNGRVVFLCVIDFSLTSVALKASAASPKSRSRFLVHYGASAPPSITEAATFGALQT